MLGKRWAARRSPPIFVPHGRRRSARRRWLPWSAERWRGQAGRICRSGAFSGKVRSGFPRRSIEHQVEAEHRCGSVPDGNAPDSRTAASDDATAMVGMLVPASAIGASAAVEPSVKAHIGVGSRIVGTIAVHAPANVRGTRPPDRRRWWWRASPHRWRGRRRRRAPAGWRWATSPAGRRRWGRPLDQEKVPGPARGRRQERPCGNGQTSGRISDRPINGSGSSRRNSSQTGEPENGSPPSFRVHLSPPRHNGLSPHAVYAGKTPASASIVVFRCVCLDVRQSAWTAYSAAVRLTAETWVMKARSAAGRTGLCCRVMFCRSASVRTSAVRSAVMSRAGRSLS